MSKELVPSNGAPLPDLVESQRVLERIAEKGDKATLREASSQAAAHQEYERRNHAKHRANHYGKIKVTAEALLGRMDVQENLYADGPLEIDGDQVAEGARRAWRLLGVALLLGMLDDLTSELEGGDQEITTYGLVNELSSRGWGYVQAEPFIRAYRRRYKGQWRRSGYMRELASQIGCTPEGLRNWMSGKHRIPVVAALRLARILEVPRESFKPAKVRRGRYRRRLRKPKKLVGGRLDESYSLIRKALQELDRATGQSGEWGTAEAWDHLYKAETIIGKALNRAA